MKMRWIIVCVVALALLSVSGFGIYYLLTGTTLGLSVGGAAAPSGTLVGNLSSSDRDLVMSSLELLKKRSDPAGQTKARTLLSDPDDYIWFNAALYLGAMKDSTAIPYLIKGLKHPAYRSYPEVVADLEVLTGQHFGMDQAKWIEWWKKLTPGSTFSFAYGSMERQSADIRTGSNLSINRVIDPLTISYNGSTITLIGLRVKAGTSAVLAQNLLKTAILGQFAEIERDGTFIQPDGSVPALIYWEPDTINSPDMADFLRRGLPPVPFTHKTSVQKYLLDSGLYELDLSTVHDRSIIALLRGYPSVTRPAASTPSVATPP